MSSEMLQIDDLLIDKFNPYAVPGMDTFSPGLPQMLGGYKGRSTLDWYDPSDSGSPFSKTDKSTAAGMPSVGDYTADYVSKPPRVWNNQPGWAMEFDGIDPLIKSSYGLDTFINDDAAGPPTGLSKMLYKSTGLRVSNFVILMVLLVILVSLVVQK